MPRIMRMLPATELPDDYQVTPFLVTGGEYGNAVVH